jgi:hypothetical protein
MFGQSKSSWVSLILSNLGRKCPRALIGRSSCRLEVMFAIILRARACRTSLVVVKIRQAGENRAFPEDLNELKERQSRSRTQWSI